MNREVGSYKTEESLYGDGVRFTSKTLDEDTGLYYFNARWYDPNLGRFITEDPIKDGNNWYLYANNNPLRFTDPTGLKPNSEVGFAVRNPYAASQIGAFKSGSTNISTNATRIQWEMPLNNEQREGSSGNAFRHALWQATIMSRFGLETAVDAGIAHDPVEVTGNVFKTLAEADTAVDQKNNGIGIQIGSKSSSDSTMTEIAGDVLLFMKEHGLYEATEQEDGTFTIEQKTISEEQYLAGVERLSQLDANGVETPAEVEPEVTEEQ